MQILSKKSYSDGHFSSYRIEAQQNVDLHNSSLSGGVFFNSIQLGICWYSLQRVVFFFWKRKLTQKGNRRNIFVRTPFLWEDHLALLYCYYSSLCCKVSCFCWFEGFPCTFSMFRTFSWMIVNQLESATNYLVILFLLIRFLMILKFKGTLMQMWKPANIFGFTWK